MRLKNKSYFFISLIYFCSFFTFSAVEPEAAHIVTSGSAELAVKTDVVTLTVVVSSIKSQPAEAKKDVDKGVANYFDFLLKQGIKKENIKAANITLYREYNNDRKSKKDNNYIARRVVNVALEQPERLNELLDAALAAGLNEIQDINYSVKNPEQYQEKVQLMAIANAKQKAERLAKEFGMKLGQIYRIQYDTSNNNPQQEFVTMAAPSAKSIAQTYDQQTITFTDNINVIFLLEK